MRRSVFKFLSFSTCALAIGLAACNAPPSVQKMIDEKEAEIEAAKPKLENPAQIAAQESGREFYNIFVKGTWASQGSCSNDESSRWVFEDDKFTTSRERTCRLAIIEELTDGRIAVAGYCPRVKLDEEAVVMMIGRTGKDKIVVNSDFGGGPLVKCSD